MKEENIFFDIYKAIAPSYWILKVIGLAPFPMDALTYRNRTTDIFFRDIAMTLLNLAFPIVIFRRRMQVLSFWKFSDENNLVLLCMNILQVISALQWGMYLTLTLYYRSKVISMLRLIAMIDEELVNNTSSMYRRMRIVAQMQITIVIMYNIVIYAVDVKMYISQKLLLHEFERMILHCCIQFYIIHYLNLLFVLKHRFNLLNKKTESVMSNSSSKYQKLGVSIKEPDIEKQTEDFTLAKKITELRTIHRQFFNLSMSIHSVNNYQVTLEVASVFLRILSATFFLVHSWGSLDLTGNVEMGAALGGPLWAVSITLTVAGVLGEVLALSWMSDGVSRTATRLSRRIGRLLLILPPGLPSGEAQMLCREISAHPVRICHAAYFAVDLVLAAAALGVVTSWVINLYNAT